MKIPLGENLADDIVYYDIDALDTKHIALYGSSGSGKTSFLKYMVLQLLIENPEASIHIFDSQNDILTNDFKLLLNYFSIKHMKYPVHIKGLPFNIAKHFLCTKNGISQADLLIDDLEKLLQFAGGIHQVGFLEEVLEQIIDKPVTNFQLKGFLESHLKKSSVYHRIKPLLKILRSSSIKDEGFVSGGDQLIVHDFNVFKKSKLYLRLFLDAIIRVNKKDNSKPVYVVFEEAHLLEDSQDTLETLFKTGRKYNINGVFINQELGKEEDVFSKNSATILNFTKGEKANNLILNGIKHKVKKTYRYYEFFKEALESISKKSLNQQSLESKTDDRVNDFKTNEGFEEKSLVVMTDIFPSNSVTFSDEVPRNNARPTFELESSDLPAFSHEAVAPDHNQILMRSHKYINPNIKMHKIQKFLKKQHFESTNIGRAWLPLLRSELDGYLSFFMSVDFNLIENLESLELYKKSRILHNLHESSSSELVDLSPPYVTSPKFSNFRKAVWPIQQNVTVNVELYNQFAILIKRTFDVEIDALEQVNLPVYIISLDGETVVINAWRRSIFSAIPVVVDDWLCCQINRDYEK